MDFQKSWKDRLKSGLNRRAHSNDSSWKKNKFSFKGLIFSPLFLKLSAVLILLGFLGAAAGFAWLSRDLPNPNQLQDRQIAQSTKIYDRTGEHVLYDIHGDEQRTLVELKDIPNSVKWATVAIEDKDFYKHRGFSLWAIFRTVITNVFLGQKAGASTLTQQFVKNAILTSEKSYIRKAKELILAYNLEKKFSKDEILQMYLNEIPYGSTAYGVEAAAQRYFGKNVKDVSLAEAAILAALPQSPSYYSPYGNHKDALIGRQRKVLKVMVEQGYISEEDAESARNEELEFTTPKNNITAPHFVMYVKELLAEKYDEKMVEQGGLKIYTTLDLYKQEKAEEAIAHWWEKNLDPKNASTTTFGATNAALVSIDPKNGQVLAMVGSRDYFNDEIDGQVNITTSSRQPGSSLKPLVYAALFTKGYTPNTILYDVVTNFSSDPQKPYEPKNFNLKEYGPIAIKKALGGSLNTTAVKATYLAGLDYVLEIAKKFGYTTLNDKERFGMSLALGGAEVKLIEHANAYAVFAREGKYHPLAVILKVEDRNGKILEEWKPEEVDVMDPNVARMINNVLSDNSNRSYIFGEFNNLILPNRPVASKTGTTNDYRDAWTMGYTPSLVAGVWVGNNNNTSMKKGSSAANAAGPIWNEYMKTVLGDTPVESFKIPEIPKTGKPVLDGELTGTPVKIDSATGLLATEFTPLELIEEKIYQEHHSILYYINKEDPLGPAPKDPKKDSQFEEWEKRIQEWAIKQAASSSASSTIFILATGTAPTAYDNVHTPENKPKIRIVKPVNNEILTEAKLSTDILAEAPRGIAKVYYYINNNLFAEKGGYFFNLTDTPIDFLESGYHNLKIKTCDDVNNCSEASVEINLVLNDEKIQTNFNGTITWPTSGLAVSKIDFPLNVKFEINNPRQAAKIEIYSKFKEQEKLLGKLDPAGKEDIAFTWRKPNEDGAYTLYGKIYGWGGEIRETNSIIINIGQ
jgi:1A family penicillin-binding protein